MSSALPSVCSGCGTQTLPGVLVCPRCGRRITAPAAPPAHAQLSPDGAWFWTGSQWVSAVSPDGAWRWSGTQWVAAQLAAAPPAPALVQPPPAPEPTASSFAPPPPPPPAPRRTVRPRLIALGLAILVAGIGVPLGIYALQSKAPEKVFIYGYASLAMPLAEGTVELHEMQSDGQPGKKLASAVTESDGYYDVWLGTRPSAPLLVTVSGGEYADSAVQRLQSARAGESLRTVLSPGARRASLTPFTTWATARAVYLAAHGSSLAPAVDAAFAATARQFNLESITDFDPAVIDNANDVQMSGRTSRQMGLILAGLDAEARDLGVTPLALADAVAEDLGDGALDGSGGSAAILIDGLVALPADATTARLQAAVDKVAASPANKTHLPAPKIALQAPNLDLNTAGSLYVSSTVLPAWIDGQQAGARVAGSGGTAPYTCELVSGTLPKGFSLASNCTLAGGGTRLLGKNTMLISNPFAVRLSDSAEPPHSVEVELRITIVGKPPTITVSGGRCPQPGEACSLPVATATGGTPPYYFKAGSFASGAPPMGMTLSQKGVLSGKPSRAGTYAFSVCVVDLVGATDCATVTVVVGEATRPPDDDLPSGFPTDLPAGTYRISVCTEVAGFSTCADGGEFSISDTDAGALADGLAQAAEAIRNTCNCSVSCTAFNGTEFDMVITDPASGGVTRIRVVKVR